jgi:hypothetical protein
MASAVPHPLTMISTIIDKIVGDRFDLSLLMDCSLHTAAGKLVSCVEQPLGDHHFSREEDRLGFLNAVEAFLAKHNPPD